MTPPPAEGGPDGSERDALYRDLLLLHALAPEYRSLDLSALPGHGDFSVPRALRAVAAAPRTLVGISARLAVLYDVARSGPHADAAVGDAFGDLAVSTLPPKTDQGPSLAPADLIADLNRSAAEGKPFATTPSAQAFEHQQTAFIGQDVCTIRRVRVGEIGATWLYSEFETDAPLAGVADWIDPRNWSTWGYLFFRRMELLGAPPAPVGISPPPDGDDHWQGVFHEEVRLIEPLNTLLRCVHWRGPGAAAVTYDLDLSLDGQLDVDRGFLLVTDTGAARRVQVLKIVGFTDDLWNSLAPLSCPFWTDWIRAAVLGATTSGPVTPTQSPESGTNACVATVDAWVRFLGDATVPYVDLGNAVSSRVRSGAYSAPDLLADGTRLWSQLAKDWASAWTSWSETVQEVAREGLDAGLTPPGVPREVGRHAVTGLAATPAAEAAGTVVPVVGIAETDRLVCSELVSIDASTARLPANDMSVTVESLAGGTLAARVLTTNTSAPVGLYVGRLDRPDGQPVAPVHLYVSRATGA
jgi:hypothetical protein